jgi:DNA-binding response OmpR family regulator
MEKAVVRILLVEDDEALSSVLARGLREHAFAVDVAADGEEAERCAPRDRTRAS